MPLEAPRTQHFINNEFVDSADGKTFDTINPATEKVLATVQSAGAKDVDNAVAAATKAFATWRDVSGPARRDMMLKLADLVEANKQQLAEWESLDNGKPISVARDVDVYMTIQHLRYYAGWADKGMQGKTIPVEDVNVFSMTVHEPIGVVGAIIPWNFPILMLAWKWAPLLACGCTCVLKSSEKTPLTALMMCDLARQAGFPPGVLNVISGGGEAGALLARHPGVKKVCFTGSSAVGRKIVQMAGESNLKKARAVPAFHPVMSSRRATPARHPGMPSPMCHLAQTSAQTSAHTAAHTVAHTVAQVTLELGGKSPLIICDDADLDAAVEIAHVGLFLNHGQCCCASSRIFVHESVHDAFAAKCVERAKKVRVHPPRVAQVMGDLTRVAGGDAPSSRGRCRSASRRARIRARRSTRSSLTR